MLTPSAIAALAELGFYYHAEPCSLRYILDDINEAIWNSDNDDYPGQTESVIAQATRIAEEGWLPADYAGCWHR